MTAMKPIILTITLILCQLITEVPKLLAASNVLTSYVRNLENYVNWQKNIVAENFSDKNEQHANERNASTADFRGLRNTDFRLPHILHYEVKTQENKRKYRFEKFAPLLWLMHTFNINPKTHRLEAKRQQKLQDEIPWHVRFPCNTTNARSKDRPTSVDHVRPGDIDLIASFGDSFLNGNGLAATRLTHFINADDDISPSIGGRETWRQYLTLPNILKEFNPNLIGYAKKSSGVYANYRGPTYNFAVPSAVADDLITMAQRFVTKAKNDTRVEFKNDWKLINVIIGGIHFCIDICYWKNPYDSYLHTKKMMEKMLDYLMENSPRTIVSVIPFYSSRAYSSSQADLGLTCRISRPLVCPCLFADVFKENIDRYGPVMRKVTQAQREVVNDLKYQIKKDFVVLEQPILEEVPAFYSQSPRGNSTDWRYLAPDCLHLSQRGMATLASGMWNALLTPFGYKKTRLNYSPLEHFVCPSEERPFIATNRNSYHILRQ